MKSYSFGKENYYYYGPSYCPGTWKLESIDVDGLDDLEGDKDITILAKNESRELEEALEKKYLSYTKLLATADDIDFVIYETDCQKCKD